MWAWHIVSCHFNTSQLQYFRSVVMQHNAAMKLLAWSVVYLFCAATVSGKQSCTSGFISQDDLMTLAPMGSNRGNCQVCALRRQQRLIPDINFTCNGSITKWIFGARFFGSRRLPELQIWRRDAVSQSLYTMVGSSTPNADSESENRVYEYAPDPPLQFEVGDILGILQPAQPAQSRLSIYYNDESGPVNYVRGSRSADGSFDITDASQDNALPLVTVSVLAPQPSSPTTNEITLLSSSSSVQSVPTVAIGISSSVPVSLPSTIAARIETTASVSIPDGEVPTSTVVASPTLQGSTGQLPLETTMVFSTTTSMLEGRTATPLAMPTPQASAEGPGFETTTSTLEGGTATPLAMPTPQASAEGPGFETTTSTLEGGTATPLVMPTLQASAEGPGFETTISTLEGRTATPLAMPTPQASAEGPGFETTTSTLEGGTATPLAMPTPQASAEGPGFETTTSTLEGRTATPLAMPTPQASAEGPGFETTTSTLEGGTATPLAMPTPQASAEGPETTGGQTIPPTPPVTEGGMTPLPPDVESITTPGRSQDPLRELPSPTNVPPIQNTGHASKSNSAIGVIVGTVVGVIVSLLVVFAVAISAFIVVRMMRRRRGKAEFTASIVASGMHNPVYLGSNSVHTSGRILLGENSHSVSRGHYQYIELSEHHAEPPGLRPAADGHGIAQAQNQRRNVYSVHISDSSFLPSPYEQPVGTMGALYEWGVYVPSEARLTSDIREINDINSDVIHFSGLFSPACLAGGEERNLISSENGHSTLGVGERVYAALQETQYVAAGPDPTFFEEADIYWKPSSKKSELFVQLATKKYREIPRYQIQLTEHLGSGQFGTVNKGIWQSPAGAKEVAVKTLKSQASEMDAVKFLKEAAINGQFKHPNVVKLFGVVTIGEPVMIVLELYVNGDLKHYLIKQKPAPGELVPSTTPGVLLNFCRQVAAGMEYLARKAFIHRDLAARNILVAEDRTCKVGDFGMSRDLEDEDYYVSHGGKIPVKWTAPEALNYKKYSTASDVWSFGVLMYEIWSLGCQPFEAHTNAQAIKLVDSGYRLPPPPGCPREIYKRMIRCWHPERHTRPQFSQLSEALNQPDFDLLTWSEEDAGVHHQAVVLGAPLEAGKQLYPELQDIYRVQRQ